MRIRPATADDIDAIAALHTDSWRRNYRGALSDEFLDGPIEEERRLRWTGRLVERDPAASTTVAIDDDGRVVGLVHTIFDVDPVHGALLENLHVAHDIKRSGVGTQLMAESARAVLERPTPTALHLTVLAQNAPAQAFYEARGGERVGEEPWYAPDGGTSSVYRYYWPDPSTLL